MLRQPVPPWILVGGFLLAGTAGCVNAVGFLGIHHQALSHMSGTATIISTELGLGRFPDAFHASLVLLCFFLGCMLSGIIIRQSTLRMGRRYGVALAVESALLFAAVYFFRGGSNYGDYFATMACGLQNAMATTYTGTVIRTTHVTGIVTDLGIAAGNYIRREPVEARRISVLLVLLAGFLIGGTLGALGHQSWGFNALLVPAVGTGLIGSGYALYRHLRHVPVTPAR